MLRIAVTAAAALTLALAAGAQAGPRFSAPAGDLTASPSAWVKVSSCSRAERSAVFYARMRRLEPGQRMWMRFTLLERGADGRFAPVDAPALRRWRKSKPGVRAFGYRQRVRGLAPDAVYRSRVDYRWYGEDGKLDHRARRRSGPCSQGDPLPNLRARIVGSSAPSLTGPRRYTVRLANVGLAVAESPTVRLAVEGASSDTKTVADVPAGGAAFVSFQAPACTTGVVADADPSDALRESNETDNAQRLACSDVPE